MEQVPTDAGVDQKPPWWLITSWSQWVRSVAFPVLLSVGQILTIQEGRGGWLSFLLLVGLALLFAHALIRLAATLLAWRRDPGLRERRWAPTPPPRSIMQTMSRRTIRLVVVASIAGLGVLVLFKAGWSAALFIVGILGVLAYVIDRFNLFTEDIAPMGSTKLPPHPSQDAGTPDR